jgi:hypothetical protein
VTRLQPHNSRQSAQCPLSSQLRKYRCDALSVAKGHKATSPVARSTLNWVAALSIEA